MIPVVLSIVGFVVIGRLLTTKIRASRAAMMFTASAALSGIAFSCQVFPDFIDRTVNVVNLSDILHHTVSLVIMALSLLYVETLTPPYTISRRSAHVVWLFTALLLGLLWMQWLTLPDRTVESGADAGGWENLIGPLATVTVVYNAYIVGGFAFLSWKAIFGAREWFAEVPLLRRASAIMGYGLALMGVSQTILVVRLLVPQKYEALTSAYWSTVWLQTLVFTVGLVGPVPANALAVIRSQRRQTATLDSLWRSVTAWFPDAELRATRRTRLSMTAVAATRRFVEIGDGLSRLLLPRDAADRIRHAADPARALGVFLVSFEPDERGAEGGEPALGVLPSFTSPHADQRQLLLVARAFNESRLATRMART